MGSFSSFIYHRHWAGDSCDRRILGFTGPQAFLGTCFSITAIRIYDMQMSSSFTFTSGNVFSGALPHLFPNLLSHFCFSTAATKPQTDVFTWHPSLGFLLFLQLHTSIVFNIFNISIYLPYYCLQMSRQAPNIETRAAGKGKVTCK
ncbi:hypothetical protein C8J56DRAFT_963853 [Mycena floridula]|nr:hypothetical protein C8J56DRAFT_963853 [Mycena floridula]